MGSFSIIKNIAAVNIRNQLNLNKVSLNPTLLRLSSGNRIDSRADDAAGSQIAGGALQEISNLTEHQVLVQPGVTALAKSGQDAQVVLTLLRQ